MKKTIKPMLAQKLTDSRIDWSDKVYIQPKLDGVRCIITKSGAYSRAGNRFMNVKHIRDDLKPFFKQNPKMILDGELYNHELKNDFEKIISLVRKQKPLKKDRVEAEKLIQFHIYDYISTEKYSDRHNNLVCSDFYNNHIKYVDTYLVKNMTRATIKNNKFLDQGYEGSILRLDTKYEKKRSWGLQKFKAFQDAEATIIGWEEGKGKRKGTIGKFYMEDDEGVKFGCPPGKGFTYKDMAEMSNKIHEYIGQKATFTYFQRTQAGSYRHPLFKSLRNYE